MDRRLSGLTLEEENTVGPKNAPFMFDQFCKTPAKLLVVVSSSVQSFIDIRKWIKLSVYHIRSTQPQRVRQTIINPVFQSLIKQFTLNSQKHLLSVYEC